MSRRSNPTPKGKEDADKRQILLRLSAIVIRDLKKAALDHDTSASAIAEVAIADWLKKDRRTP